MTTYLSNKKQGIKIADDHKCDLLQEKGPSNFAFLTAFRRSQLSLTAFQKFDTKISY